MKRKGREKGDEKEDKKEKLEEEKFSLNPTRSYIARTIARASCSRLSRCRNCNFLRPLLAQISSNSDRELLTSAEKQVPSRI